MGYYFHEALLDDMIKKYLLKVEPERESQKICEIKATDF